MADGAIPTRIGGYDIRRLLATGTMGDVYQGTTIDPRTKTPVYHAVKVLNPKVAKRLEWCVRFKSEIKDDHLMEYREVEYDSKYQYYFVSDYLEVKPASRQALRRERSHEILDCFVRILEGMEKAHKKKYIHGNIKTSNVLVRRAEGGRAQAILNDWGISYVWDPEYFTGAKFDAAVPYMSPERIREYVDGVDPKESKLTPAADTYSLTATLVETLSGTRPFSGAKSLEELDAFKRDKKYLLLHVNFPVRHVDIQKLNEAVRKGLSYDVAGRFGSAAEMASALSACKLAPAGAAV